MDQDLVSPVQLLQVRLLNVVNLYIMLPNVPDFLGISKLVYGIPYTLLCMRIRFIERHFLFDAYG